MPTRYLIVLAATTLAGLVGWGIGLVLQERGPPKPLAIAAPVIKHYTMVDHTGQAVDETTFHGRWVLMFFGFTRCPDICPTSMIYASRLLNELGPLANNLQIVFVTVDPANDTAPALREYLANFDPRIVGLTGTAAQVATIAQGFGVHYAKEQVADTDDYTMHHSGAFYLVDPQGGLRRAYNLQRGEQEMTDALRAVLTTKE